MELRQEIRADSHQKTALNIILQRLYSDILRVSVTAGLGQIKIRIPKNP